MEKKRDGEGGLTKTTDAVEDQTQGRIATAEGAGASAGGSEKRGRRETCGENREDREASEKKKSYRSPRFVVAVGGEGGGR